MALRVSFQEELDRTEAALQEEGELVLRALRGALNALWEQDAELSDEVIAFDDQIDGLYFRIHTMAYIAVVAVIAAELVRAVSQIVYFRLGR